MYILHVVFFIGDYLSKFFIMFESSEIQYRNLFLTNTENKLYISFLYFENGLGRKTEILAETNFRSFTFYLPFKMLRLIIFFAIKLLAQVNIPS